MQDVDDVEHALDQRETDGDARIERAEQKAIRSDLQIDHGVAFPPDPRPAGSFYANPVRSGSILPCGSRDARARKPRSLPRSASESGCRQLSALSTHANHFDMKRISPDLMARATGSPACRRRAGTPAAATN